MKNHIVNIRLNRISFWCVYNKFACWHFNIEFRQHETGRFFIETVKMATNCLNSHDACMYLVSNNGTRMNYSLCIC